VETVPLETYVLGVLAGEMPAEFELEALKAQAIAARTYIIRKLAQQQERSDTVTAGADVTDTVADQVYVPKAELAQKWADAAVQKANLAKLKRAVGETEGLVITYEGEPIQASFFSTSNGYTENSEDYWDQSLPYLRSVDSPWDIGISPRYKETVIFTREELYSKLGITGKPAEKKLSMKVLDKTEGNRVKTVRINGVEFSGREFRERLGLASSQFSWKIDKQEIAVTTYGYGHGVGMSQWGANGMALEGKRAVQILRHYYTGTKVEQASKLSK
jgi:stage II sporulation protein D